FVPPAIVEPLIALSITYVCVENILTRKLTRWRPAVVFGFGLLHGLGFAGVLQEIGLAPDQFVTGLISFNIGVELGQLSIIAICFALVGIWFRNKSWYRAVVVVPASLVIGTIGAWWFIERVFLSA
ncbi:MAG TPA: HupE/UreJ family protein, partial [Devosia sp.]|nr:HupE/UreJ family protein [Devosia sp.]